MKHLLFLFLTISILFISCKKDKADPEPAPEKDRTELLTGSSWQIKHLNQAQSGQKFYYDRGGSNNTHDYAKDLLKFNTDGSGVYTSSTGVDYNFTWQFDNMEKTELSYTLAGYGSGTLIKLENILIDENNFRYSEMYMYDGFYSGGSIYRISKP